MRILVLGLDSPLGYSLRSFAAPLMRHEIVGVDMDATRWRRERQVKKLIRRQPIDLILDTRLVTQIDGVDPVGQPDIERTRWLAELAARGVLSPEDAAEIIDTTRQALPGEKKGKGATDDSMSFLRVKRPNEDYYREIPFGMQTYLTLREEIAVKFGIKSNMVHKIYKEPDILIADDDDVVRLLPTTVLEVIFKAGI